MLVKLQAAHIEAIEIIKERISTEKDRILSLWNQARTMDNTIDVNLCVKSEKFQYNTTSHAIWLHINGETECTSNHPMNIGDWKLMLKFIRSASNDLIENLLIINIMNIRVNYVLNV